MVGVGVGVGVAMGVACGTMVGASVAAAGCGVGDAAGSEPQASRAAAMSVISIKAAAGLSVLVINSLGFLLPL